MGRQKAVHTAEPLVLTAENLFGVDLFWGDRQGIFER